MEIPATAFEANARLMLGPESKVEARKGSPVPSEANARLMRGPELKEGARKEPAEQANTGHAPAGGLPKIADEFRTLRTRVAERSGSPRRVFWLGYGAGNNGLIEGMTYDAGTHNLFLDALGASGVIGFLLVASLWIALLAVGARLCLARPARALVSGTDLVTALGLFTACALLLLNACLVNWRIDNLGTSLNGTVLWLLIATACEADRAHASGRED
jgi:hypothetical protein